MGAAIVTGVANRPHGAVCRIRPAVNVRPRRTRCSAAALLGAAAWLAASAVPAFADTATPENPAATNADAIDSIYRAALGVTITIFVLVGGWLLYTAIRFRARKGQTAEPPQTHGSTRLELGWTLVPILILIGLAGYTFAKLPNAERITAPGELRVQVLAQQFSFSYTYPNGKHPANPAVLVVPVDTPVELDLRSKDVAHDWWVAQLGPKVDAIPGRMNRTGFTATTTGTFTGQCAEFCGTGHATMTITVRVVPKAAFQHYLAALK